MAIQDLPETEPSQRKPLRSRLRSWLRLPNPTGGWDPERTTHLIDRLMLLGFLLVLAMAVYIFFVAG